MFRWFFIFLSLSISAQNPLDILVVSPDNTQQNLPLEILNDPTGKLSFAEIGKLKFQPYSTKNKNQNTPVQWIKFLVKTSEKKNVTAKISITFTDKIQLFVPDGKGNYLKKTTGDLVPISEREVPAGQMVFAEVPVFPKQINTYFARLESQSDISRQFRSLALGSVKIYSESYFQRLFIKSRLYQAFFYGAILVIWFYNLFLYLILRDRSTLLYVLFLLSLLIFLSSNSGFLAELFFDKETRFDLYVRFISTPVMLLFYILFSKSYLKLSENLPKINSFTNYTLFLFVGIILLMLAGFWALGRTIVIIITIYTFIFVAVIALLSLRKGFMPSRYFLIANSFFIPSGIIFAAQRLGVTINDFVSLYHPLVSIVFQIAFFSLGLAENIRLTRQSLLEKNLENERLERQKEAELKKISDEKNEALQKVVEELDMFIYKTAHDIRGPLARLLGLSQVALIDVQDLMAKEYLSKLDTEAKNLNYILARLSKVYEVKHINIKKEPIHIEKLTRKIWEEEKQKVSDIGNMRLEISGDFSLHFVSDPKLVEYVLRNLIENTIRFRKTTNNSFINISFYSKNNSLIIRVIDNGIGIDPQYQTQIFDMFTKAAGIHKTAGLGLYITKLAVEKLEGSIQLVSNTNGLTEFQVEI